MTRADQSNFTKDSVAKVLSQYRRRVRLITWIGAGLIAVITVYAAVVSDLDSGTFLEPTRLAATILEALIPTCVVVAGGLLALARAGFEWRGDLLDRYIDSGLIEKTKEISEIQNVAAISEYEKKHFEKWPSIAEVGYRTESILALLGGILLVGLTWLPLIDFWLR